MKKNQVLKIHEAYGEKILKIKNKENLQIHEWFGKETQSYQSYPVNIVALNVGWLLSKDDGY